MEATITYIPTNLSVDSIENLSRDISENLDDIKNTLTLLSENLIDGINSEITRLQPFPVNSVFLSVTGANPFTLLGYGTWEEISKGRVLLGNDETHPVASMGGTSDYTLTLDQMPKHNHEVAVGGFSGSRSTTVFDHGIKGSTGAGSHNHTAGTYVHSTLPSAYGSVVAGANTALTSATLATVVNHKTNGVGNHTHNITIGKHSHTVDVSHSHAVTQKDKGLGESFKIETPYFAVSVWMRTK